MWRDANPKPITAMRRIQRAVARGACVRADRCEICGLSEDEIRAAIAVRRGKCRQTRHVLTAHHEKGYVESLSVWWVCPQCNTMLWGRHDGALTLDAARALWRQRQGATTIKLAGGRCLRLRP